MKTRYSLFAGLCLMLGAAPVVQAQPGSLDPTFNTTGYQIQPVNTGDGAQKILVQDDQKVLLIGFSFDANYVAHTIVKRFLPDGSVDAAFGDNGTASYVVSFEADTYSAILTPAGKILLAGTTDDYQSQQILLIQLNEDGSKDLAFGDQGVVVQSIGLVTENGHDNAYDVALDAAGNIVICGSSYDENFVPRPIVSRFSPAGVLDTTFGVDGVATIPVNAVGSNAFKGVVIQPDGKIVASGYFGNTELWYVMLVVRFNTDGSLDPTFGDAGIVKYNYSNVDDEGEDLKLTPDGSILVCGISATASYNYSALLVKFNPAGALDLSFGSEGVVFEDLGTFDFASNLAVMPDGGIVMTGTSGSAPPSINFGIAAWKYTASGTPDMTFGTGGVSLPVIPTYGAMIYAMGVQADGKILVGGQARTSSNQNYFLLARLENDFSIGVPELSGNTAAMVFPNPATASSTLSMQISETVQPDAQISLYAADGRLVFTSQAGGMQRDAQRIIFQLPVDLAPGIYQLAIQQQGTRRSASLLVTH